MFAASPLLWDGLALLDAERALRAGLGERRASFELGVAEMPAHTGFLVAAGVEEALASIGRLGPNEEDVRQAQRTVGFGDALAERLTGATLAVDVDAVPDGTPVFAGAPIVAVEGPLVEVLLAAARIAPALRRGTAIATRAARLHIAAGVGLVVDGAAARASSSGEALAIARAAHVGGAASTTSALAAAALGIPFRGEALLDLGALAPEGTRAYADDGWGSPDQLVALGGSDEEARLVEVRRQGVAADGWIASGLADTPGVELAIRVELVALEQDGVWAPRRGASGRAAVLPGRKMVARYADADGRAMADVVHLAHERMRSPRTVGAARLVPLSRSVMRGGRALEAPEPARVGRERSVAARQLLPPAVTHLRAPARYPVELSPEVIALRDAPPPAAAFEI